MLNDTDDSLKVGRRVRGDVDLHSIFTGLIDEVRISKVIRYTEDGYAVPERHSRRMRTPSPSTILTRWSTGW